MRIWSQNFVSIQPRTSLEKSDVSWPTARIFKNRHPEEDEPAAPSCAGCRADKSKQTARMEFQPILELLDVEAEDDFAEPAELIQALIRRLKEPAFQQLIIVGLSISSVICQITEEMERHILL